MWYYKKIGEQWILESRGGGGGGDGGRGSSSGMARS